MSEINDSSGQAHPYWYEWFVGLVEVIKLLNPDEKISDVAFQVASIQGWDDVVVTHAAGKRFYQVKHTRSENSLTFGNLVERDEDGKSLLQRLFEGAKNSGIILSGNELVLYTNRKDGVRWAQRSNGDRRPPLLVFWKWLESEIKDNALASIEVPPEYRESWVEWVSCFENNEGDARKFLNLLSIRTREDDLEDLESRICSDLATAFGITDAQSKPLFNALCAHLKDWTTGHSGVTVEILYKALSETAQPKEYSPAPPPPTPFFPSRLPIANDLKVSLADEKESPVLFLSGEAGSGKTSVVSWLANNRTDVAFEGTIGIRFFCFEPIRPDQPFISPDASRVKPEELWFSLLSQLRRGLLGRLHDLDVPLSNSFLTWSQARVHVLRLADALGHSLGKRFVISIDGIDHAARAAQVIPQQVEEFFASLPAPDEINSKWIRLLIAGQPPEHFAHQYPTWLIMEHQFVRRIDLPSLKQGDIEILLLDSVTLIPRAQFGEAARLIDNLAVGNTLSTVFAIAEAELCSSLVTLEQRLRDRSLGDGLSTYYRSIWRHALGDAQELSCSLAAMISLSRTPINARQLFAIFSNWNKPLLWWETLLVGLGPLLTNRDNEFLIKHNDVRVFLTAIFYSHDTTQRQTSVSLMADYFGKVSSERLASHLQLFNLLSLCDRSIETTNHFTVDWVLEGTKLGIDIEQLQLEGETAAFELSNAGNWEKVVSVSCALQTLNQVRGNELNDIAIAPWSVELPPFLPSEASVLPIEQWTIDEIYQLIQDAEQLIAGNEISRAQGLLARWLKGLGIEQIVRLIPDIANSSGHFNNQNSEPRLGPAGGAFELLGSISAKLQWTLWGELTTDTPRIEIDAFLLYEKGLVDELTKTPIADSLDELFSLHSPRFFDNHELAVRNLALAESWILMRECLIKFEANHDSYTKEFLLEAAWYALRAGLSRESVWISYVNNPRDVLLIIPKYRTRSEINLIPHISLAAAIGAMNTGLDTGDIANLVCEAFESPSEMEAMDATKLLFRSAAVVGRLQHRAACAGWLSTSKLFTPKYIERLLKSLWGDVIYKKTPYLSAQGVQQADLLANMLTDCCAKIGEELELAAFKAALPFAEEHVLGSRINAIWEVVNRNGKIDVLRRWIQKYIEDDGEVWLWSTAEAKKTISDLAPLARSIGLNDVAERAEWRGKQLVISYNDTKNYAFESVLSWFSDAAMCDPSIWKTHGWCLWQLCKICEERFTDNQYRSKILTKVTTAAILHGKNQAWWRMLSTTLANKGDEYWHSETRQQYVDGYTDALKQGLAVTDQEIMQVWSIALSLSYWTSESDTSSLQKLKNELLSRATKDGISAIETAMRIIAKPVEKNAEKAVIQNPPARSESIAAHPLSESDWWKLLDENIQIEREKKRSWSYPNVLMSIAHRRAKLHGADELIPGLMTQLQMHTFWAFGGIEPDERNLSKNIPEQVDISTDEIFIQLVQILLNGYSAEVTSAALEGLHAYVANNPSIIDKLFDQTLEDLPRRWLLSASEAWAVLYPHSLNSAGNAITALMEEGDLNSRLQAWIVLCRNADALKYEEPVFPLPDCSELSPDDVEDFNMRLLDVPATQRGAYYFANRFSSVKSLLGICSYYNFDFHSLEGLIAERLFEFPQRIDEKLLDLGPHRYQDFTFSPFDSESAFGSSILSIISSEWMNNARISRLCQALMTNEDAWVYRSRPKSIESVDEWPKVEEHYGDNPDLSKHRERMLDAVKSAALEDGWSVFSARVQEFTWNRDFDLQFWYEEIDNTCLVSIPSPPTCPAGRSFMWGMGGPIDMGLEKFYSGLFVGGHQRLSHCHFEICMPKLLCDEFGWTPNPNNPLEWTLDGIVVAKYERVHGVLRDTTSGPSYRQPIIERWIVTNFGFELVNSEFINMRERVAFETHAFES